MNLESLKSFFELLAGTNDIEELERIRGMLNDPGKATLFLQALNIEEQEGIALIDGNFAVAESVERKVSDFLITSLRVNPANYGCEYKKLAIMRGLVDPTIFNRRITNELYPAIAGKFGITNKIVGSRIRNSITESWPRVEPKLRAIFFKTKDDCKPPKIGQYLAITTAYIRNNVLTDRERGAYRKI